jgi:DNA-binding response OmpR family regulator
MLNPGPEDARIIVVEDDAEIRELVTGYLARNGFRTDAARMAGDLDRLLLTTGEPDLIVLDLMLPGEDGLSICRRLRAKSRVPILMLTARADDIDRIVGLECGADDYVIKPLNPRELVSRTKNLVRRVRHAQASKPTASNSHALKQFADWALDTDRRRLIDPQGGETLLTHGEFQLLSVFLRNSGHTLSRDQLMDQIRNREWVPNDRSIDVLVGRLRRKLHDDPAEPCTVTMRTIRAAH